LGCRSVPATSWTAGPGGPALHLTAAAEQLLEHLAALEGTTPADQGIIAVLARAGAQMLMSGIEMDESAAARKTSGNWP
jgi:hypothetical protein